jgi:hypothetical protein
MADHRSNQLSPHSPVDDDSNNGVDTFPALTETPAAMSPVPGYTGGDPSAQRTGVEPPADGVEDDESWSTESEHDDESYVNAVQRIAGSGTDPIDSRSIYHALFGGGAPTRNTVAQKARKLPELSVYKLALGAGDVESVVKLEEACFMGSGSKDKVVSLLLRYAVNFPINCHLDYISYRQSIWVEHRPIHYHLRKL